MPLIIGCDAEGCDLVVEWSSEDFPAGWWETTRTCSVPLLRIPGLGVMPDLVQRQRVVAYLCPGHRPVRLRGESTEPSAETVAAGPPTPKRPEWVDEVLKKEEDGGPR
jgi:hypothetical protein